MKSFILIAMILVSFSSLARVEYGIDNEDIAKITVLEEGHEKCEEQLAKAHALVLSRNKAQVRLIHCVEVNKNSFGFVFYHKYL